MKTRPLITLAISVVVLAGCAAPQKSADIQACDAFAYYVQKAESVGKMDRKTTIQQVEGELKDATPNERIADALAGLKRTQDNAESTWVLAADVFAATCIDLGWKAT